jgi:hypothetical protein
MTFVDLLEQRATTRPLSLTVAVVGSRDVQPTRTPGTGWFAAFFPAIDSCTCVIADGFGTRLRHAVFPGMAPSHWSATLLTLVVPCWMSIEATVASGAVYSSDGEAGVLSPGFTETSCEPSKITTLFASSACTARLNVVESPVTLTSSNSRIALSASTGADAIELSVEFARRNTPRMVSMSIFGPPDGVVMNSGLTGSDASRTPPRVPTLSSAQLRLNAARPATASARTTKCIGELGTGGQYGEAFLTYCRERPYDSPNR